MWVWSGTLLALPSSGVCSKPIPQEDMRVTVSVYDDAEVGASILGKAEEEASRVFRQSGIEVKWLNCPLAQKGPPESCAEAVFPTHLQVRIARRPVSVTASTVGISFLSADGRGCYADLFYERVEELRENTSVNLASILGLVAAHEIGHLLLGTNSHAPNGIMRAHWSGAELASVSKGRLLFSGRESQQMRARLSGGLFSKEVALHRNADARLMRLVLRPRAPRRRAGTFL
jgi:hypothetical protein